MANNVPAYDIKVAYLYSDAPSYVRAKKTLKVLQPMVRELHFIGCSRSTSWDSYTPEGVTLHLSSVKLGHGPVSALGLPRFLAYVRDTLRRIQPDVVIVVNDEYLLPFTLGYLPRPRRLICDMYDSISLRVRGHARHLNPLWRGLSRLGLRHTDALIEVIEERLARHPELPPLHVILPNAPDYTPGLTPMKGMPSDTYVYVSGTFSEGLHGMESLLEALDLVPEMHVIATGKTTDPYANRVFFRHPRVHFLGLVPYEDVPRIAAGALAVYSHYNPARLNYVYGAPNKLYEAMMAGVPVLINEENRAKRIALEHGIGLVSPYGEAEALACDLRHLLAGDDALDRSAKAARAHFKNHYDWTPNATRQYAYLFDSMNLPRVRQP